MVGDLFFDAGVKFLELGQRHADTGSEIGGRDIDADGAARLASAVRVDGRQRQRFAVWAGELAVDQELQRAKQRIRLVILGVFDPSLERAGARGVGGRSLRVE